MSPVVAGLKDIIPSLVIPPIPVISPVALMSQSDVSMTRVSPPSPKMTLPPGVSVNAPVVVNVVDAPSKATLVSAIVTSELASKVPLAVNVPVTVKLESAVSAVVMFPPVIARSPPMVKLPLSVKSKISVPPADCSKSIVVPVVDLLALP